jgi:hypothetical protein
VNEESRMSASKRRPSVETVIKDPVKHFATPREVVNDSRFTTDEKLRILESWALDAQLLSQADDESMTGKDRPGLREVKLAILELQDRG